VEMNVLHNRSLTHGGEIACETIQLHSTHDNETHFILFNQECRNGIMKALFVDKAKQAKNSHKLASHPCRY
jgi:hypothetical protein